MEGKNLGSKNYDMMFPAIEFLSSSVWDQPTWSGTTFTWHPTSEAPPVMGLVFEDAVAAQTVFGEWIALAGNQDAFEELRVSIVEGDLGPTKPGYIVHMCPDPENTLAHATAKGIAFDFEQFGGLCRANKMDFLPDTPPMLARFKEEYAKHREFLLAPVTRRRDGQMYFDVNLGIVKREIHFLASEDILAELKAQGIDVAMIAKMLEAEHGSGDILSD